MNAKIKSMLYIFLIFSSFLHSSDVLLITLDTTRADHINEKVSPFLFEFSKKSIYFENCRTPVPITLPAHASVLTGLYPKNHKVRNNSSYKLKENIKTIQEILKENGYFTAAFVSSFILNRTFGLNKGFDVYDDETFEISEEKDFEMQERNAFETTSRALKFLNETSKDKIFLWVHYFDPHFPYLDHPEAPKNFSLYEKEIYFMDIYVKKLIEAFEEKRKGIIIIAGDHGESLGEHGEETHGIFIYESVLKVPLIIKVKEEIKKQVKENVSLIDIFPTILGYLKIKIPEKIDGINLFEKILKRNFYFESYLPSESFGWATPFGVFDGKYKFIFLPKKELYNLIEDPGEEKNLYKIEERKAKELFKDLKENYSFEYEEEKRKILSIEETKKLQSLGYFKGSKPNLKKDPKDLIWVVKELEEGRKLASEKKYREAEEKFKKIIKANPENYPALIQYGNLLKEEKRIEEAERIFKESKNLNPDFVHGRFNLGVIYFEKNKLKEAKEEFLKLLELIPTFGEPYFYLIRIYLFEENIKKAEEILEKAKKNLYPEANIYFFEGLIFVKKKDYKNAILSFEKSLNLKPDYFDAKFNLAQCHYKTGEKNKALKNYIEALKLNPEFPDLYLIIGSIYLNDLEELKKAKFYFNEFLKKFPGHKEAENVKEILKNL